MPFSVCVCMLIVADAVFESVAQVLLSRSRGLKSRFEQTMMKIDAEVSVCSTIPLLSPYLVVW